MHSTFFAQQPLYVRLDLLLGGLPVFIPFPGIGVLVLSRFAGASEQLSDALLVNPYDIDAIARAIRDALAMPLEERKARHAAMKRSVFEEDIVWWRTNFLARLDDGPGYGRRVPGGSVAPVLEALDA